MRTQFDIFPWNSNFHVGIAVIDEQHQKLAELINKLATHVALNNEAVQLDKVFVELNDYARIHFKTEEAIWHLYLPNDELEINHHLNHENFFHFIDRTRFEANTAATGETHKKIIAYLVNWLTFHILDSDKYMANVCLAMQVGKSLEQARAEADDNRDHSKTVLSAALLKMVNDLSELSFRLSFEIDQRQKAQAALAKALSFSKSVINSMQDGLITLDRFGAISEVNPAFCTMTGFSNTELVGCSPPFPFWPAHKECRFDTIVERVWKDNGTEFEIQLVRKNGLPFSAIVSLFHIREEGDQFVSYAATVKDITERKNSEEQALKLSFYDPLTNLANRRLFYERLSHAMDESQRNAKYFAVAFIDLDNFKTVNDARGHALGDLLLKEVARRIKECVRAIDTVSRFGGDEFVVLFANLNPSEARTDAESIAQKIRLRIAEPFVVPQGSELTQGGEIVCTASIGVTISRGHKSDVDELVVQADQAMYRAKAFGRNAICFHDSGN